MFPSNSGILPKIGQGDGPGGNGNEVDKEGCFLRKFTPSRSKIVDARILRKWLVDRSANVRLVAESSKRLLLEKIKKEGFPAIMKF